MPLKHTILMIALLAAATAAAQGPAPATPADATQRRFALGEAGGWDDLNVDASAHRLYLSRSDRVMVVDTVSGKLVGEVPDTSGIHGIALAPELHRGFTSNGKADTVTVFDLGTLKALETIKVTGSNPDAIVYDPATKRVLTFNGHSSNATVIDAVKHSIVGTIALDGKPEFAVADGHGRVFVNIEDKGELSEIDTSTMKVLATWPLPGCEEPSGLALDDAHRRLFSACDNGKMAVTDADTGKHVADIAIGAGPDGAAFEPARGLVLSPNGKDGTLTVAHEDDPDHYRIVATIPTQKSARTMVLDKSANRLYLPAAEFDALPANAPPHTRPPMKPDSFVVLELHVND
ncbi:MAG TPA: YncE family protein [Xanthomonadaceae bacterium]|jgi:DNA-binding beta-propeller fold protein YncE|nr:YncE family protein [Xanthomonadaceae bacterium]